MQREYIKWKSPSLGRDMEMLIFGKGGTPVLVFPTDHGRFYEWEDQGTVDVFSEQIEHGYNQFFFVDSVASESFLNKDVDPYTRLMREEQYELYIIDEVLPYINDENNNPFVIAAGAELGAYQSLRLALKNPELFDKVISISGYYDINLFLDGFKDDNSYYNNPVEFIPNLNDDAILKSISSLDLRLISYLNDSHKTETLKMSDILWMKFLQHDITVWKEETSNPWALYPIMLRENLI
ncbi:alpha/beta hydrolase-fold protein [Rhodohalobacter mucosus]|uniref:Esterase n=1 Tax=Rhodohalobacter mucosus TaxID=2079485 RepID=A0A316TWC7_9BACT|nr:alpha/beta hydrolase-fold protein [Rhodohalobacter mucosus]PWN07515.1 esterase [Rhodohalobacter mucosus]